jgi:hypothetical protein
MPVITRSDACTTELVLYQLSQLTETEADRKILTDAMALVAAYGATICSTGLTFKGGVPIPDDHFENEPGPPRPLEASMSPAAVASFNAETEAQKRRIEAREEQARRRPEPPVVEFVITIDGRPSAR